MGREIRMVPAAWEHPKDKYGKFLPMFNRNYAEEAEAWVRQFHEHELEKKILLKNGKEPDYNYYWEYDYPPDEDTCVPYTKTEANWYQVYETVSEGTPVTPPFETQQELIDHLVEFGETFNPYNKGGFDRKSATKFVMQDQWVMSGMSVNGIYYSGIEACGAKI